MFAKTEDSPEQKQVLQHLKELFYTTPLWKLRKVCVANDWNLELCLNQMTNTEGNLHSTTSDEAKGESVFNPNEVAPKPSRKEIEPLSAQEQKVGNLIKNGYRVMVLMRGLPGVGKTHSARALVKNYVDLQPPFCYVGDFIFSTDDYFCNSKGVYKYNVNFLSEAHEFNQSRVREKAISGLSPIIVDNTNMKAWEMLPYVKCAVENGYLIEIVEPKPSWGKCAYKLSQRNMHGVPADKIRQMMDKYEKTNVPELLKMLKTTKYKVSLPQYRLLPPIDNVVLSNTKEKDKSNVGEESVRTELSPPKESGTSTWTSYDTNAPKGQRKKFKTSLSPPKQQKNIQAEHKTQSPQSSSSESPKKSSSDRDVYSLLEQKLSNVWKPYEAESVDFWGIDPHAAKLKSSIEKNKTNESTNGGRSLIDLLRDQDADKEVVETNIKENEEVEQNMASTTTFNRHSVDCPNENVSFVTLRQIYPNKEVCGLWDLFVKCNGDIDWAVDILLKEDELAKLRGDTELQVYNNEFDDFVCSCRLPKDETQVLKPDREYITSQIDAKVQNTDDKDSKFSQKPQRPRFARPKQISDPSLLEVKENIENCFVLGDDHYSKHILKIRNSRNGITSGDATSSIVTTQDSIDNGDNQVDSPNGENDDDDDIGNDNNEDEAMLEMSLGEHLVQQLLDNFRNESSFEEQIPSTLPLNLKVFMPRSLAKQLYMLWMESAYNHLEEERQQMVREDEDFARLLKHPKYSEYKQSPSNIREMLDIEYAWNLYKRDKEEFDLQRSEMEKLSQPTDLAAHLTQMKLCETFPDIPRETLLDILSSTDNNYKETVSILQSTMNDPEVADTQLERNQNTNIQQKQSQSNVNDWDDNDNTIRDSSFSPEAAKRLALKEFEEARNLAAHHCQLRAECYQKAKEAIQAGNGGAGLYYSQIANLHKQKIDMYNHRAANCIMSVHKYTQNNPDHLDLHYFHLMEAMACLDLFLDRHITSLRSASRNYKYVFIITGRGKHSAGGVSVIKSKVKGRLEERCLKWSEVNPGLLKVKVFSSSRHSQNF